jgi:CheY-like chemotaxis protein
LKHHLILIVDDDILSQALVSGIIAAAKPNSRTITANCGREALTICREQPVDCVLVDYEMPDMDGLTLVRHLREQYRSCPSSYAPGRGRIAGRRNVEKRGDRLFPEKPYVARGVAPGDQYGD